MGVELWPSVDVVIFTVVDGALKVLLTRRSESSSAFPGQWSLPGGALKKYVDEVDTLEEAAALELKRKTGAEAPYLEQLETFGGRARDPRSWTVTVAYFALLPHDQIHLEAGKGTEDVMLWDVTSKGVKAKLAFDHKDILISAVNRLRSKLEYTAIAGYLLGKTFTLPQLKSVYESILGESIPEMSFRRAVSNSDALVKTNKKECVPGRRPTTLYRFKKGAKDVLFFPKSMVYGKGKGGR